jgi:hypothetical protein
MAAMEHYASPSAVAPTGGFATGEVTEADKEAKNNRDRYHWSEIDMCAKGGWLKDWLELNLDQQTIYETQDYRIRLRNCYRDTGECLIHARKGKMFATYNLDLMVKWHACHKVDGRIVGECRGRFKVTDFSSEHCDVNGGCREGCDEKYGGDHENEGEWEFSKKGVQGPGADQMDPALKAKECDISDAERHLKKMVGERGWAPVRERLSHLHRDLAKAAAAKVEGITLMPEKLPLLEFEKKMKTKADMDKMVRQVKKGLRSDKFPSIMKSVVDKTCVKCELRCLSLTDDDVVEVVNALSPKNYELLENEVGLEVIDLSYNELTDAGVQKLMFSLAAGRAPHLKQLNVHKTLITEVSRRQLAGLKLLRKTLSVLVDDEDKKSYLAREL